MYGHFGKTYSNPILSSRDSLDLLLGVGPECSNGLAGSPNLLGVDLGQLLVVKFSVVGSVVEFQRSSGLATVTNRLVQRSENGQVGLLELGGPVKLREKE